MDGQNITYLNIFIGKNHHKKSRKTFRTIGFMDSQTIPITLFLNQLSDAIIVCDSALQITRWNEAAQLTYGWTSPEALGQQIDDLLCTTWNKTSQAQVVDDLVKIGAWRGEVQQRTKEGHLRQIWSSVSWLKDADGQIVGGITINRDMTEEVAAREALNAKKERQHLEAVLRKEQEWNSVVEKVVKALFHDMKTPLSIINSANGIINRYYDQLTPDQRAEKSNSVQAQVRRISQMIDDASQLVKGSIGAETYRPHSVNLSHLCEVCVSEIRDTLADQHTVVFKTDGLVGQVELDEMLISRVLVNLLSNALKYSPDTSEVTLGLYKNEDHILIQVSDSGIGISPEDQAHLFEAFFRSKQVGTIDGTGLGLSIVRDCVELHHGTISVDSALNEGTTFTVQIPFISTS